MAPLADDRLEGWLHTRWSELWLCTPGRGEFALRLALICALTTWVAQTYELPDAALSAYLVFFMNKPDRTGSIVTSIAMTVLISLVIGLLLLIADAALDIPALRVSIMATLSLSLLFLASASKLKPFASTISLILAYALDVLGKMPGGELATRALLYAWMMIGVPAGVSIVVNLLIGPAPRKLALQGMALRLRAAQAFMLTPDARCRRRVAELRRAGGSAIQGLMRFASIEKTSPAADVAAIQQAARSTDTLLMVVEAMAGSEISSHWRAIASARLGDMAGILKRNLYPVDIQPVHLSDAPADAATATLLADFNATLATFAVAPQPPEEPAKKAKSGFFSADAWSNPAHIRYAVKVTVAATICYLFYSLADWPGIHTCLITCYIVSLPTAAETVEKMSLRIAGALVGAAAGLAAIVWMVPLIDHLSGLLTLVFVGALAGGWIAAGSPRVAYAGFQLTFAFFLCVIQGSSPAFDLSLARDRIVGIFIGNAVVYLIFVYVWPVSIADRVDQAMAGLLRRLAQLARWPERVARREQLPAAHAALYALTVDLDIARYEPTSLRPRPEWFRQRHALIVDLAGLEVPLLVSDHRAWLDTTATRLDRMADDVDAEAADVVTDDPTAKGGQDQEQPIAR
ncbi:FUSC family protein [Dyella silvae]|uniref:FUSC family protein n=1 Tax=Dyella silvae TaxID=2994424 RepID=UPI00226485B7|nr:FUSC family protein [Dyella silvae]